jgi:hypothetical protein
LLSRPALAVRDGRGMDRRLPAAGSDLLSVEPSTYSRTN